MVSAPKSGFARHPPDAALGTTPAASTILLKILA
jgi:hypothetical protein